jgi:hypothetical protein
MDRDESSQIKSFGHVEMTLDLLKVVETGGDLSQRGFAARLGIALGLTNALLKRAVKKGLIKIKDAPARRYGYYLTPKGFVEKSQLSAEFLSSSLQFFRRARNQYEDDLSYCKMRGWKRIVVIGSGELAEIVTLSAQSCQVPLVGIIDATHNMDTFCGLPVYSDIEKAGQVDAYIVADALAPQQVYDSLIKRFPEERIFTPSILHVSRNPVDEYRRGEDA